MTVIEIRNLKKIFSLGLFKKNVSALDDVSISVSEGEIFGFLGPNGAGKTTTLKIMMGLNRPTSGTIEIFGKAYKDPLVRKDLGYLPEQPYFYDYLTAYEFLAFYGGLFSLSSRIIKDKSEALLKLVGLEKAGHLPLRKFSKGMLQRIGIAQALINDPKLIILDEPMSGLDPIGRRQVRDLILQLKREGRTVFFSSHIISDVEMICDRVVILNKGKVMAEGTIDDLLNKPKSIKEMEFSGLNADGIRMIASLSAVIAETSNRLLIHVSSDDDVDRALEIAKRHGGKLVSLVPHKQSLEELFTEKVMGKDEP
jgi:ABC-2 type transport system ATP-binding protein